jgi:hypothetical protein
VQEKKIYQWSLLKRKNMNIQNNIDIFTQFKNKNIQEEQIVKLLAAATKEKHITEIQKYGCNLLFFAGLHDNDNAFKFLVENFSTNFKEDFKKCVLLTYTNKNPNILKLSLQHLDASEEEKEDLLKKFATSCFRHENIDLTQRWLADNLNVTQLKKFISELFRNNNKPYLIQISKIPLWRNFIQEHDFQGDESKKLFYNTLISGSNIQDKVIEIPNVDVETVLPALSNSSNSKPEMVILKKKRKINNLVNA